jgi:hypothetical protein
MNEEQKALIKSYAKGVTSRKADNTDDTPPMPRPRPNKAVAHKLGAVQDKQNLIRSPEDTKAKPMPSRYGKLKYPGFSRDPKSED